MHLGASAPAPLGYLNFCARLPEQCGLASPTDAEGRPVDTDAFGRALTAKYYWSAMFTARASAAMSLTPAAGAPAWLTGSARRPAGRLDWTAIFGPVRPYAPAQVAVQAAQSPSPSPAETAEPALKAAHGPLAAPAVQTASLSIDETAQDVQPLPTSGALMAELDTVNRRINQAIRYVPERVLSGNEDYWRLPLAEGEQAAGDCKDYVLEKRRALIADGVPAADLSIAIVLTPWGETHAVLLVTTDRGELVLDSLSPWVRPWRNVRYTWLERQAPGRQLGWVSVAGERDV